VATRGSEAVHSQTEASHKLSIAGALGITAAVGITIGGLVFAANKMHGKNTINSADKEETTSPLLGSDEDVAQQTAGPTTPQENPGVPGKQSYHSWADPG